MSGTGPRLLPGSARDDDPNLAVRPLLACIGAGLVGGAYVGDKMAEGVFNPTYLGSLEWRLAKAETPFGLLPIEEELRRLPPGSRKRLLYLPRITSRQGSRRKKRASRPNGTCPTTATLN